MKSLPDSGPPEVWLVQHLAERRRRRRRIFLGAGGVALVIFLAFGPSWMIGRADKSDTSCASADYEATPGDSEGCAWRARAWIVLPKLVPWTRSRALNVEADILWDQATRWLERSVKVKPSAAARDEAAAEVLARARHGKFTVEHSDGTTSDFDPSGAAATILTVNGAHAMAAEAGPSSTAPDELARAYFSALAVADLDRAEAIARAPREGLYTYELDRHAGAFLCLRGDAEAGRARLALASQNYEQHISSKYAEAAIASILCGERMASFDSLVGRSGVQAAMLHTGQIGVDKVPDVDLLSHDHEDLDVREARSIFVAAWLNKAERSPREAIDVVAPLSLQLSLALSPYDLGAATMRDVLSSHPVVLDPERHEKAADKLEKLASAIDDDNAQPRPLDDYYSNRATIEAARANPPAAFRRGAAVMWLEAATLRAALRQSSPARSDLARYAALTLATDPDASVLVGAIELAIGDDAKAMERLQTLVAAGGTPRAALTLAEILLALIAMKEQRWEDAHSLAKVVGVKPDLAGANAWLLAATAVKVGRPQEGEGIVTPTIYERDGATWEALVAMDEKQRTEARFRMWSFDPPTGLTLPSMFYVVGEAARGADPEVWLDVTLSIHYRNIWTPGALRARAEAARWRGDDAAAKLLDERAERLLALADTPERLVLAKLAGII